jgi:hypothetical protein
MITMFFALPYYNWQYAKEHGFVDWLIWGEITPTAKAFIWPYLVLHNSKPQEARSPDGKHSLHDSDERNISSAFRAVQLHQQATAIIDDSPTPLSSEQTKKVIELSEESLRLSDMTDEQALNKLYPEFGTRFKRELCEEERLTISGLRSGSANDLLKAGALDRSWVAWYTLNRKQFEDAFNSALQ